MLLKFYSNSLELRVNLGHGLLHFAQGHGCSNAGHDVLSLGVHEVVAVEDSFAGTGVAGETDSRAGSVAGIAENHLYHIDGGAEEASDFLHAPIGDRLFRHPRPEHRADRSPELVDGVVWELRP